MRRLLAPLLLASLALSGPIAAVDAAAAAKPKPKKVTCKAGQARVVIAKKVTCTTPAKALAKPSGKPVTTTSIANFGLDLATSNPLITGLVPKKARPASTKASKALGRLQAKLPSLVVGTQLGMNFTPGSTTNVQNPDGSGSSSSSGKMKDSETGAEGSWGSKVEQHADGSSSATIDIGIGGASFSVRMPIEHDVGPQAKCPTADGSIDRKREDSFAVRMHQSKPGLGVAYIDQNVRYQGTASLSGHVGDDAALSSVDYTAAGTFNVSYDAKGFLFHTDTQVEYKVTASGTLDGRTGSRSSSNTTVDVRARSAGMSNAAATAAAAKALDGEARDKISQLLSDNIDNAFKGLKTAETGWQVPNACAQMLLSPEIGPREGVKQDESAQVTGRIAAKAGGDSNARWAISDLWAGTQSGLPGTSAPGAPITVKFTATKDVDENTIAAGGKLRATSKAGIAELAWAVGGKPAGPPYYFRIVGGTATQTVSGTRTTSNGVHITQVSPVVTVWNFQRSSGEPDGSIQMDGKYPWGQIEAPGKQLTEQAWTWKTDEHGTHLLPVAAMNWGGPAVSLDTPAGDTTSLIPYWGQFTSLDFQYDVGGGTNLGFGTGGPSCPVYSLPGDAHPLSFYAQRSFTLTYDHEWDHDQSDTFGHDVCHGHITISMDLERVQADGSPLP